jgi:hypothetical protein
MPLLQHGNPVRCEFTSANATTAAAISIYDSDGNAVTLGADERLMLHHVSGQIAPASGLVVRLISDQDGDGDVDAGDVLWISASTSSAVGEGGVNVNFHPYPIVCPRGITPKIKAAAAGQIDFVFGASIVKDRSEVLGGKPGWQAGE